MSSFPTLIYLVRVLERKSNVVKIHYTNVKNLGLTVDCRMGCDEYTHNFIQQM